TEPQNAWIVAIGADAIWCRTASSRGSARRDSSSSTRPRISAAAFFVYVMARIPCAGAPPSRTRRYRSTSTVVLPLPAPAVTARFLPRSSAAAWAAVRLHGMGGLRSGRHLRRRDERERPEEAR